MSNNFAKVYGFVEPLFIRSVFLPFRRCRPAGVLGGRAISFIEIPEIIQTKPDDSLLRFSPEDHLVNGAFLFGARSGNCQTVTSFRFRLSF